MLMGLFRDYDMLGTFKLELAVRPLMNFLRKNMDLAKMLAADKNITILTLHLIHQGTLYRTHVREHHDTLLKSMYFCVYMCVFMLCRGCRTGLYSFFSMPRTDRGCIPEGGHLPDRAGRAQPRHQSGERLHPEWSIQYVFSNRRF